MKILRADSFERARLQNLPFVWGVIDDLFMPAEGGRLAASFPNTGYQLVAGSGGGKRYRYESRCLVATSGRLFADGLSESWRDLISDLRTDEYRQALGGLLGIDLSTCELEVTAHLYGAAAHLDPHTDLVEKVATHVLYFNKSWECSVGGCIQILNSRNLDDSAASIPPLIGSSVALVRSADSWHAVPGVQTTDGMVRRSLTVTFFSAGSKTPMWTGSGKLRTAALGSRLMAALERLQT